MKDRLTLSPKVAVLALVRRESRVSTVVFLTTVLSCMSETAEAGDLLLKTHWMPKTRLYFLHVQAIVVGPVGIREWSCPASVLHATARVPRRVPGSGALVRAPMQRMPRHRATRGLREGSTADREGMGAREGVAHREVTVHREATVHRGVTARRGATVHRGGTGHPAATVLPVAMAVLAMMTGAEEAEEAGLGEGEEGAEGEGQRRNRKYQGFLLL